ncbi:MAG: RNA polymerase sigma factor [Candidatus Sumerlaeaceae bacterium]|nr:RNA polymerase sigma factor [Candidatus Sumerlaeaceae bacterium]
MTSSAEAGSWFATTHWSLVVSAGHGNEADSRAALQQLCERYWLPLYSYVRRRGYSPDDAQDLTQEFFMRLLQHNRVRTADQQKGRFRSFLLTSLKNFLSDEWDKAHAVKRGGGVPPLSLEFARGEELYAREPATTSTPESLYERRWALTLLDSVLARLQAEHHRLGKSQLFAALSPCLVGERASQPYAELATRLDMTETAVKSAVHRLRQEYRTLLRREIANTVATPEDVDDELNHLFAVLAGT